MEIAICVGTIYSWVVVLIIDIYFIIIFIFTIITVSIFRAINHYILNSLCRKIFYFLFDCHIEGVDLICIIILQKNIRLKIEFPFLSLVVWLIYLFVLYLVFIDFFHIVPGELQFYIFFNLFFTRLYLLIWIYINYFIFKLAYTWKAV